MWVDEMYWEDFGIKSFDNCRQATINITEQGIRQKLKESIETHNITESDIEYLDPYSYNLLRLPEWIYKDSHFDIEARIRRLYYSIKVIDQLKNGVCPANIDWLEALQDLTKDIEDNICGYIDYARLFYIVNAIADKVIRLQIIDSVTNVLKIERASIVSIEENGVRFVPSGTPINIDSVIDYLPYYRNWIELTDIPQHKPEYIPTSLTNKQLRALLHLLIKSGFVSQAQTEDDFLNSFEIEGRKPINQGKINWIKEGIHSKKIDATTIIYFIHKTNNKLTVRYTQKDVIAIIRSIFEIEVTKSNLSTAKGKIDNGNAIEYKTEIDKLFEHI